MNPSDDYLWLKKGSDPEIEGLERELEVFRFAPPQEGGRRTLRGWPRTRTALRLGVASVACVAGIAALAVATYLWWPEGKPWRSELVTAGSAPVPFELSVGERVTTRAQQFVNVRLGRIGTVVLSPRSSMQLIQTGTGRHRIELLQGVLTVRAWAPPGHVQVAVGQTDVVDLGCWFDVERPSTQGASTVRVRSGWVMLSGEPETVVPQGTVISISPTGEAGLPYAHDASAKFRAAAEAIAHHSPASVSQQALLDTLSTAGRTSDAITLLTLVQRQPALAYSPLYDALNRLTGVSDPPDRHAVASGDARALNRWWDALPYPKTKRWWLHWRDAPI